MFCSDGSAYPTLFFTLSCLKPRSRFHCFSYLFISKNEQKYLGNSGKEQKLIIALQCSCMRSVRNSHQTKALTTKAVRVMRLLKQGRSLKQCLNRKWRWRLMPGHFSSAPGVIFHCNRARGKYFPPY